MELSVSDLSVARGGVPVLAGVSLSLMPGQALVLRGANGSGKTTLLRTIAGLQPALAGTVTGAEDRIAYAGHADGLKAMLSVAENLSFWAAVFGTRDVARALDAFALEPLADRLAGAVCGCGARASGAGRHGADRDAY